MRCFVRLFTHPIPVEEQHSFVVASDPGGLTGRLDFFMIDERTTLPRLRQLIEVQSDRGMLRRTTVYQELLALMQRAPNPHGYDRHHALTYRLGYFKFDDDSAVPTLVPLEHEKEQRLVLPYLEEHHARVKDGVDLIVVPATQISPSGRCCLEREDIDAAADQGIGEACDGTAAGSGAEQLAEASAAGTAAG